MEKRFEEPHSIDHHVGSRVKLKRKLERLSQEALGYRVNLTAQQIQKYERGENRIGASRLYDLSQALGVPPSFFFDDMPENVIAQAPLEYKGAPKVFGAAKPSNDPMQSPETAELIGYFQSIADGKSRRKFLEMTKALSELPQIGTAE